MIVFLYLAGAVVALLILTAIVSWVRRRAHGIPSASTPAEAALLERIQAREEQIRELKGVAEVLAREKQELQAQLTEQLQRRSVAEEQARRIPDLQSVAESLRRENSELTGRLASQASQAAVLGEVKRQLELLTRQSESLAGETERLRLVLKSSPARGKWGEETLRRVVEAAGMSAHCDFEEQAQQDDKKPDMIVHLPGDRVIIVDAKVPDLDFVTAVETADPEKRSALLASHAGRLKEMIRDLGKRDYPAQFPNSLDYVVLFLPAESLFSAALEGDRDLIVWAAEKRIMLATPASLIALLRSVSVSWQHHSQTENAREIAKAAQELYARAAKFIEHFEKIRNGLARAGEAYNEAVGSYERMVRPSGERLLKMGIAAGSKELDVVEPLDAALRPPPTA